MRKSFALFLSVGCALMTLPSFAQFTETDIIETLWRIETTQGEFQREAIKELKRLNNKVLNTHEGLASEFYFHEKNLTTRFDTLEKILIQPANTEGSITHTDTGEDGYTGPGAIDLENDDGLYGCFLKHDANYSTHWLTAKDIPEVAIVAELEWCKAMGYNTIHWYFWVDGDYGGVHKYNFTPDDAGRIHDLIQLARSYDVEPVFWMMPDDGFSYFNRDDVEEVKRHWLEAIEYVLKPANIKYVVLGLEAVEYWNAGQCRELGEFLKDQLASDVKVVFHTHPNSKWMCGESWVDIIGLQTGFGLGSDAVGAMVKDFVDSFPGKDVWCLEYHKSGETAEAMELGAAAIEAGAIGFGNGGHVQ